MEGPPIPSRYSTDAVFKFVPDYQDWKEFPKCRDENGQKLSLTEYFDRLVQTNPNFKD